MLQKVFHMLAKSLVRRPATTPHCAGCANGNAKPFNPTPSLPTEMVCTAYFRSTRGHSPLRSRNAPPLAKNALPTSAISRSRNRRQGAAQRFGCTSLDRVFYWDARSGLSCPLGISVLSRAGYFEVFGICSLFPARCWCYHQACNVCRFGYSLKRVISSLR